MSFLKVPPWKYPSKQQSPKQHPMKDTLKFHEEKDERPFNWVLSDSLPLSSQSFNEQNQQFYDFLVNFLSANVFAPQNVDQVSRLISILQYTIGFSFAREQDLQKRVKRANEKLTSVYSIAASQKQQISDLKSENKAKSAKLRTMTKQIEKNTQEPKSHTVEVSPKQNLPNVVNDDLTVTILDQLNLRALDATQRAEDDMAMWMEKKFAKLESKIDQVQKAQTMRNNDYGQNNNTLQPSYTPRKHTKQQKPGAFLIFDDLAKTVPPPPPPPVSSSEQLVSEASPEKVTIRKRISASPPSRRKRVQKAQSLSSESSDDSSVALILKQPVKLSEITDSDDDHSKDQNSRSMRRRAKQDVIILSDSDESQNYSAKPSEKSNNQQNSQGKKDDKPKKDSEPSKIDQPPKSDKKPEPKKEEKQEIKEEPKKPVKEEKPKKEDPKPDPKPAPKQEEPDKKKDQKNNKPKELDNENSKKYSFEKPVAITKAPDAENSDDYILEQDPEEHQVHATTRDVDLDEVEFQSSELADSEENDKGSEKEIKFTFTPPPKSSTNNTSMRGSNWKETDIDSEEEDYSLSSADKKNESFSVSVHEDAKAKPRKRGRQSFY